ncbi:MAG: chemotaxis protein CheW [bacterium]
MVATITGKTVTDTIQLVSFTLGDEEYGIEILKIREIVRIPPITRVPRSPAFIMGLINLRGKVIPVIDLHKRFGVEKNEITPSARIIVAELGPRTTGLLVDSVSLALKLDASQIEPPPQIVDGGSSEYIKGVGKTDGRLIIILDVDKFLSDEEQTRLAAAEHAAPATA